MTFDLNLDLKNEVLGEEKSLRRFEDQKWKFANWPRGRPCSTH